MRNRKCYESVCIWQITSNNQIHPISNEKKENNHGSPIHSTCNVTAVTLNIYPSNLCVYPSNVCDLYLVFHLPFWVCLKAGSCYRWCRDFGASARPSNRSLSAPIIYAPPTPQAPHLLSKSLTCFLVSREGYGGSRSTSFSLPREHSPNVRESAINSVSHSKQNGAVRYRPTHAPALGILGACAHNVIDLTWAREYLDDI